MSKPHQIVDRICARCSKNDGFEGPRPFGSEIKMVAGEMLYACSRKCSEELSWICK